MYRKFRKGEISHGLYLGITQSGKSCLAKARAYIQARFHRRCVIVFCPMRDERWPCRYLTRSADEFMEIFQNNSGAALYIDEAGNKFFKEKGKIQGDRYQVLTDSRHRLFEVNVVTQYYRHLEPEIRGQCTRLYSCQEDDISCTAMAQERNDRKLLEAAQLPKGEFLFKSDNFTPAERCRFDLVEFCRRYPDFRKYA